MVRSRLDDGTKHMTILDNIESLFVDVDGTLVFWEGKPGRVFRGVPREDLHKHCRVNEELVEALKRWSNEDNFLVVWTTGGKAHADWAVKLTGLEGFVNMVCGKPHALIDDGTTHWDRHLRIFDQHLEEVR